ncbi:MAG TPA: peptidylprolyl isomerase, partial [Planctomycetota bacterium]|nr:peptidylprolyl isomerase [Planctomycetota bacterium]
KYQRKAGVKVRIIRVDRVVVNRFTGKASVRDNALELAEEMRKDIVEYGGDFKEMARERSDDLESRARSGLIQLDPKDPYIDADAYNAQLAGAIKGLKVGEVSKVFEFGKSSWAFALLEDRREAGPAPLEGELFDEIYAELLERKTRKQEDEWFRKTLAKSLVVHVIEGKPKELPIEFFFPDEKENKEAAPAKAEDTKAAPTPANQAPR